MQKSLLSIVITVWVLCLQACVVQGDRLYTGDGLQLDEFLESVNGEYRFHLQSNGNLVLTHQQSEELLWATNTADLDAEQLKLQWDGNLVLLDTAGAVLWASDTPSLGAEYLQMQDNGNAVLYTSDGIKVWETGTADDLNPGTGTGSGFMPDLDAGGGSGSETATSTGQFSTPSAALYALNDSRPRGFPKITNGGLSGNGHSVSWDGRVYIRSVSAGWRATAFRPERIVRNADGTVDFSKGAFGSSVYLETDSEAPGMHHNWLAIVPDPDVAGENPYPSNDSGEHDVSGNYHTYKAVVYHTASSGISVDLMGLRRATFIVSNPLNENANVESASFTTPFQALLLKDGSNFLCIEPTVTMDGRLIVCQGHPLFPLLKDNLVYSWNPEPAAINNWSPVKSITNMYYDDRDTLIDGIPFKIRYPIAQKPLLDAKGNVYGPYRLVRGAYPWISRDGSELFYQASMDGMNARRTGTSVVGRWTGWTIRHIDGTINRNRHETGQFVDQGRRLFISSPGAFTTMWSPFKDVADLKIPYSVRGPAYPIFGSNSRDYNEVSFDDYLDGNYVMYLGMNERLDRAGNFVPSKTNDTSGNFNNGTLVGAQFPLEYNNRDEIVGRYGQAIYFTSGTYVDVDRNKGWDSFDKGISVDFWLKRLNGSGTRHLFRIDGGLELYLTNGNALGASITDTRNTTHTVSGGQISDGVWDHVAFTYDVAQQQIRLWVNGEKVAEKSLDNFGSVRASGAVRVGLVDSTGLLLMDEVKVSNVARRGYEIQYYANRPAHKPAGEALAQTIPDHLSALSPHASAVDRFGTEAAELGEDLFNDIRLSKERSTSCATCHTESLAFTDGLPVSDGNESTGEGKRNTPALFNRLFSTLQGWSGIAASLDTQGLVPIQAAHEMNLPLDEAVERIASEGDYADRFQQIYGEAPTATNIAAAMGSFMATLFSPVNRVDQFLAGDPTALTAAEKQGMLLFEGKARCSGCHAGVNYTDESFRNNGLTRDSDIGRADVTGRDRDHGLFKVPGLREVSVTAPYMHDGSIATLREVVEAYNDGPGGNLTVDTDIRPLELNDAEIDDVVAFLRALTFPVTHEK